MSIADLGTAVILSALRDLEERPVSTRGDKRADLQRRISYNSTWVRRAEGALRFFVRDDKQLIHWSACAGSSADYVLRSKRLQRALRQARERIEVLLEENRKMQRRLVTLERKAIAATLETPKEG